MIARTAGKGSGETTAQSDDATLADQLKATMEELKQAQQELKAANESVAQYKAISAASEAALKDLSENMSELTKEVRCEERVREESAVGKERECRAMEGKEGETNRGVTHACY